MVMPSKPVEKLQVGDVFTHPNYQGIWQVVKVENQNFHSPILFLAPWGEPKPIHDAIMPLILDGNTEVQIVLLGDVDHRMMRIILRKLRITKALCDLKALDRFLIAPTDDARLYLNFRELKSPKIIWCVDQCPPKGKVTVSKDSPSSNIHLFDPTTEVQLLFLALIQSDHPSPGTWDFPPW